MASTVRGGPGHMRVGSDRCVSIYCYRVVRRATVSVYSNYIVAILYYGTISRVEREQVTK